MNQRIVFLDRDSLPVPMPVFDFPHTYREFPKTTPEQLLAHIGDADIVISNKVAIPAEVLAAAPNLKMIAVAATGVNLFNLDACREHGVALANVRNYSDSGVAEHAFMMMLALARNLPAYQRDVAAGIWEQCEQFCHFGAPLRDLDGAMLGIVGSGGIGQALAARARAFGMQVQFAERRGVHEVRDGYVEFDQFLATSDFVSLHCPLNAETQGLIGERELMLMKPGAILINTGRGALLDEQALLTALKYGQLGGAGLDVLTEEPPRNGSVLLKSRLPHLIITPHVAWTSQQAMAKLVVQLKENIEAFVRGEELRRVV